MRLTCPECSATLSVKNATEDDALDCPKCGATFYPPPEDDEEEAARPKKKKKAAGGAPPAAKIAGTLLAAVAALGAIYFAFFSGGGKPDEKAAKPKDDDENKMRVVEPPVVRKQAVTPAEVTALFELPPGKSSATKLLPLLTPPPVAGGAQMLTASATPTATAAAGKAANMTLDEIKSAVAYIRVESGGVGGSGSGFLVWTDGKTGIVATNQHVVAEKPRGPVASAAPQGESAVTVVFDGGLSSEYEFKAEVIGSDPEVDLALLRIKVGGKKLPRPIDPRLAAPPRETTRVRICGFPFGEGLATSRRAPAVTIGTGTVSSVRRDDTDKVSTLQIDGSINPGNSGGPIVDEDGRLVGVAVATIRGTGIGLSIPAADLVTLMDGRVLPPTFAPGEEVGSEAVFEAVVGLADPLGKVKGVTLHAWAERGDVPEGEKDAAGRWKPIAGAKKIPLPAATKGEIRADVRVPKPTTSSRPVVLQLEVAHPDGAVTFSRPVTYFLVLGAALSARDAVPLATFKDSVSKYQGQVVVVRGKYQSPPVARWTVHQLTVVGEAEEEYRELLFLTTGEIVKDLDTAFAGVPEDVRQRAIPARVTVMVGTTRADGTTPLRVVRLDLLGRTGRALSVPLEGADKKP